MNKIVRQFEPSYIGNGWGNYIDIENYKYDVTTMRPLHLVRKNEVYSYHIDINNKNNENNKNKKEDKAITSLIIKVSSTTFITLFFTYFVYKII
jgi:hypothetical protein